MPLSREKKALYPSDWPAISLSVRRDRAKWQCEWIEPMGRCRAVHGQPHPITGSKVVLTCAHLDHVPGNVHPSNLMALCQLHHLRFDAKHHAMNAAETRRKKLAVADLFG